MREDDAASERQARCVRKGALWMEFMCLEATLWLMAAAMINIYYRRIHNAAWCLLFTSGTSGVGLFLGLFLGRPAVAAFHALFFVFSLIAFFLYHAEWEKERDAE